MKIQLVYKFKSGIEASSSAQDVYNFTQTGNGDFLRRMIKGKLDNQDIVINGENFKYNDLDTIEIKFVECR
jgi:hypothetical protein